MRRYYGTITKNPLRGAVLLPPKQVIVSKDQETGRSMVAYVQPDDEDVVQLLPGDTVFQKGLAESCANLDSKSDANYGWLEEMEDVDHLLLHIRGVPHDY